MHIFLLYLGPNEQTKSILCATVGKMPTRRLISRNTEVTSKTVTAVQTIFYEIWLRNKHFEEESHIQSLIILNHPKQRIETAPKVCLAGQSRLLKNKTSGWLSHFSEPLYPATSACSLCLCVCCMYVCLSGCPVSSLLTGDIFGCPNINSEQPF